MSRFDISDQADFARVTSQGLTNVGQLFGLDSPQEWNLYESSYRAIDTPESDAVVFHVFRSKQDWGGAVSQVSDMIGRRKVKYQFPYKDGQTSDDLGAMAGSFTFNIVIHGPRYLQGLRALQLEFQKPTPGVLRHPIYGELTVIIEEAELVHQHDQRKAVAIKATFSEHSYTIGALVPAEKAKDVKTALGQALEVFSIITSALNKIEAAVLFTRAAKQTISELLSAYDKAVGKTLTDLNTTFNAGGDSTDIPNLLPTDQGGIRNADGSLDQDTFTPLRSVSDPFNDVSLESLSAETATALAVPAMEKRVQERRDDLAAIITKIEAQGEDALLEVYDQVIELRRTAILLQNVLEAGVASNNAYIRDYETPHVMSLRDVAWANGIGPDRVEELDLLNPEIESVNFIAKGDTIKVPIT